MTRKTTVGSDSQICQRLDYKQGQQLWMEKIYVIGGYSVIDRRMKILKVVEMYDPANRHVGQKTGHVHSS